MPEQRTALLLGATGLVGAHLLDRLLADGSYARVVSLGRRASMRNHPRLTHHVIDFDRSESYRDFLAVDDVFCCLGTTIKQAGSQEAFRRVDYQYPVDLGRLALEQGASQYLIVTALGSNSRSPVFYSRIKGEVEEAVRALPYDGIYIFRPSILVGNREEPRRGEQVSERLLGRLGFLLKGPLRKYRPTRAQDVAAAMLQVAEARPGGVQIFEPPEIEQIARGAEITPSYHPHA